MLPEFENNTEEVPGMDGIHYRSTEYGERIIPLEVSFVSNNLKDYSERFKALASWLRPDHGVGAFVSDNDPEITYYAVLDDEGLERVDELARMGEGELEFVCPDPFGYGREISQSIYGGKTTIANAGTYPAYPVFDLYVKRQSSLISIKNYDNQDEEGNPHVMELGEESEADDKEVDAKKLVLQDTMQSTSGWTKASAVDNGTISGKMVTDENGFYAEEWGDENPDFIPPEKRTENDKNSDKNITDRYVKNSSLGDWVGPSLQSSLGTPINDSFTLEALIENRNDTDFQGNDVDESGVGIIEIYMRDINDNKIAKISFGDSYSNKVENGSAFEKGRKDALGEQRFSMRRKGWNDFDGKLYVKRDTDEFAVEVSAKDENGEFVKSKTLHNRPIAEGGTQDRNPLKTIQVAIRKYNGSSRIYNRIKEVKLYDSVGEFDYLLDENKTPVELNAGDNIKVDMANNKILLNGEPRPDLLTFDADYFSLVEGLNDLKLSDNVTGTVSFKNRYV